MKYLRNLNYLREMQGVLYPFPMSVQGVSTQVAVAAAISHAHSHLATAAANKRTSWRRASKPAFYAAFYATADEATGGIFE